MPTTDPAALLQISTATYRMTCTDPLQYRTCISTRKDTYPRRSTIWIGSGMTTEGIGELHQRAKPDRESTKCTMWI